VSGELVKVRFLIPVVGATFSYRPGKVVLMTEEEAEKWCDGRRAELLEAIEPDEEDDSYSDSEEEEEEEEEEQKPARRGRGRRRRR